MEGSIARAALAAALLFVAACDIPQDPRNTLAEVTGDTLYVGVTEAPPWVEKTATDPRGIEPYLVREFARSIGAEIHWSWGPTEEIMEALSLHELDLVIGGFTRRTPWRKHVGLTRPYHSTVVRVAGPPGAPPVTEEEIEDRVVAVQRGGPLAGYLRQEDADARPVDELAGITDLVAAPDWRLSQLGRDTTGFIVTRHRHVLAVPPGENRMLMAVEDVLHRADVGTLIERATGGER